MNDATTRNNASAVNPPAAAWRCKAGELAEWAMARLVNRTDCHGAYMPIADRGRVMDDGRKLPDKSYTAPAKDKRVDGALTLGRLVAHFRGRAVEDVVGTHAIGRDGTCRWAGVDIDAHTDAADPDANRQAAEAIYDKAVSAGFASVLLTESSAAGGYHLRVLLADPVQSARAYHFARWLVAGHADVGLAECPETFPKQPELSADKRYGNWLRLPGRHHTTDHWSKVYDGLLWLEGAEAVDHLLSHAGDPPDLIPPEAAPPPPPAPVTPSPRPTARRNASGVSDVSADKGVRRCRAYLDKLPASVSGKQGHNRLFQAACECLRFGLSDADAMGLLTDYNDRADPSWPDADVARKLAEAHGTVNGDFGCRLREPDRRPEQDTRRRRQAAAVPTDEELAADAAAADHGDDEHADGQGEGVSAGDSPIAADDDFALTDAGNGERVAHEHAHHLRRVGRWNKRITFAGGRWVIDETGAADRMALATMRTLKKRGARLAESDDERQQIQGMKLLKFAHACESHRKLKDMLARADTVVGMSASPDELDVDPDLFNVTNGTLDLRTLQLRPHDPADLLTKRSPVAYDPAAECPTFLAFLDRIFDGNGRLIEFIQRAAGYTLTGHVGERQMFVLHGSGSNGKSTLLDALRGLLGDYATNISADSLMLKQNEVIRNDVAKLKGARFVAASESDKAKRLDENLVKAMTGGTDMLTARFLYAEEFSFHPTFKVWLGTNHKPEIRGTDPAIWDRIRLIPFNVRIPDDEKDKGLAAKLAAEAPGILNWCLAGLATWRSEGLGMPAEVAEATAEYRAESDPLTGFLSDCCVLGRQCRCGATELFTRYNVWAKLNHEKLMTQTAFGIELTGRGFAKGVDSKTDLVIRLGIGLRASTGQSG